MGNRQFSNYATSILAATITNSSTTVQLSTGDGAKFPSLSGTQYFIATVQDTAGNFEYVKVTAVSGDNLTVVRGQEGSTALGFTANLARVELRDTAGTMAAMYQKDGDTLAGPMNMGGQNITNGILGANISIENAVEIVNTPIRGATGATANQITVPADGSRAQAGGVNIMVSTDPVNAFTVGMIIMWNGAALSVPTGWHVCDGGTYNGHVTPDLRDKFIVGAGNTYSLDSPVTFTDSTTSVSAGSPSFAPFSLTVGQLPAHAHPFDFYSSAGSNYIGDPGFTPSPNSPASSSITGGKIAYPGKSVGSGNPITITGSALAAHNHSVSITGGYALYYIMYTG